MALPLHSQITLKEQRVQTVINLKGDTLVQMRIDDAKFILAELLDKEIVDSLVNVYMVRDAVNKSTIQLHLKEIKLLQQKSVNYEQQVFNLEKMIANKDEELVMVNNMFEQQKKETRKQKNLKKLGFIGTVVLPIIVLLISK
jgi:hypothetical protein